MSWYQESSSLQQSKLPLWLQFQVIKRTYPTFRLYKDMIKDHIPFKINVTSHWIMLPLYELSKQPQ